jgi:CrcB protein
MSLLSGYAIVFLGAGLGGALRHGINQLFTQFNQSLTTSFSTLFINVTGSLIMGLLAGWFAYRGQSGQHLRLFFATGILGGYTTFSTFSLDAALLWERGESWSALSYVTASVVLSIAAVFIGLALMRPGHPG